jgi:hypothetical protein
MVQTDVMRIIARKGSAALPEAAAVLGNIVLYFLAFLVVPYVTNLIQPHSEPPPNYPSSPRDVIFLYGTYHNRGIELALRSLNATGSRARVVLFLSPTFGLTSEKAALLASLNVEAVQNRRSSFRRKLSSRTWPAIIRI